MKLQQFYEDDDIQHSMKSEKGEEDLQNKFFDQVLDSLLKDLNKPQNKIEPRATEFKKDIEQPKKIAGACTTRSVKCNGCSSSSVECLEGEIRTGGGCNTRQSNIIINSPSEDNEKEWLCSVESLSEEIKVFAICCKY